MDRRPSPGKRLERRRDTDEEARPPTAEGGKQIPVDDDPGLLIPTPIQIPSPIGVAGNAAGYEQPPTITSDPETGESKEYEEPKEHDEGGDTPYVDPDATDLGGDGEAEQELFKTPPPEETEEEPDHRLTPGEGSTIDSGSGEPDNGPQLTIGTGGGYFSTPDNPEEAEDAPPGSIEVDLNPEREPLDPGDRLPEPGAPSDGGDEDGTVPANEPTEQPEPEDGGSDAGSPDPVSDPEPSKPESAGTDAPTTAEPPTGSAGGDIDPDDIATEPDSSDSGPAAVGGSGGAAGGAADADVDENEDEDELEPIDFSVTQDPPDEPEKEVPAEEQETKETEDEEAIELKFDDSDATSVEPLSLDSEDFDFTQDDLSQEDDDDFDDLP